MLKYSSEGYIIILRVVLTYVLMAHVKDSIKGKYLLQNITFQSLEK